MKLFKVSDSSCEYDDVEHCIIVAKNEMSALILARKYMGCPKCIEEIDLSKEGVIHVDVKWG